MPDFNIRSDSLNVEQIMEQIRARIREKRGVDYTEQQIRELAAVKLEKFLDPRGVRSDLLERFRTVMPADEPLVLPNYRFEEETLFETHRGLIRFFRKLFRPQRSQPTVIPHPLPPLSVPTPAAPPHPFVSPAQAQPGPPGFAPQGGIPGEGPGQRSRRRRRRRGRRNGSAAAQFGQGGQSGQG